MFSQTAEYALRAMVWLATRPDAPQTSQHISEGTQVPADYLSKVMQLLGRAGLVSGQRGKGGGFVLSRPARRISVLAVVNAVDPIQRIRHCPLKLKEHRGQLCPLHHKLDQAVAMVESVLADATIAEMIEDTSPGALRPLNLEVRYAR